MIQKILRIQLIILFVLTLFSFVSFHFEGRLPDNYFSISSNYSDLNSLYYYFFSFSNFIEYASGPWVLLPFILFSLFYSFSLIKRDYLWDLLNAPILVTMILGASYFFTPSFIGKGLLHLLGTHLKDSGVFIFLIMTPAVLFFLTSYKTSIIGVKIFKRVSISLMADIVSFIKKLNPIYLTKLLFRSIKSGLSYLRLRVPEVLKGEMERKNRIKEEKKMAKAPPEEVEEEGATQYTPKKKGFFSKKKKAKKKEVPKPPPIEGIKNQNYEEVVNKFLDTLKHKKKFTPLPDEYFEKIIERIESKLGEFRIDAQIINVLKGPVVDTFELELGPGVKVSKVNNHSQDLSLALYGAPIRIVYPMRGRTTLGIEVPRSPREIIFLEEILKNNEFRGSQKFLPLAMGQDAFGEVMVTDLASMPHMLVAGATGAGKSVFINTLLVSLLIQKSPKELKLLLIDPKQLELALYSELPHLMLPVLTDAGSASNALIFASQEMERRYSILKEFGVRNIEGFNTKLKDASDEQKEKVKKFFPGSEDYSLPYLVVIIDEFADLILTRFGKEIEANVCRLAAKARAAGIHLIVATQRPSVDVITGLIKSNFPTRVSFRVTTSVDSRTILNSTGAELLLGKGDMLYKSGVETLRVHSSFITEDNIEELVSGLQMFPPIFDPEALDCLENGPSEDSGFTGSRPNMDEGGSDNLFDQAVNVVMENQSASASMLQRRLKIGYNRAANLIEEMEGKGIVGPQDGPRPRKILKAPEGPSPSL